VLIPNKFLVLACCIGALQAILTEYKTTDRMSRQSKYDKAGQFRKADFKSHMPVQTVPTRHWNIKSDDLFIEPNKLISLPYFFLQPTRKYIQQLEESEEVQLRDKIHTCIRQTEKLPLLRSQLDEWSLPKRKIELRVQELEKICHTRQ
jgi:hypothetical protein